MQNTRFKLAEVKTQVHVARLFIDDCIGRLADGTLDTVTASMAKLWITETQCRVMDECLQLFGGYGYTTEYPICEALRGLARAAHLRRRERGHEGNRRAVALTVASDSLPPAP